MTSTSEIYQNHKARNIKILLIRITWNRLIDRAVVGGHTRSTAASRDASRFFTARNLPCRVALGDRPRLQIH